MGITVEEGTVDGGAGQLVEGIRQAAAVGEPDARGVAPETARAAAGIAGFPLDLVVVHHDVELARADIRAIDEHQLEAVELVDAAAVIADVDPVHAEGRTAIIR